MTLPRILLAEPEDFSALARRALEAVVDVEARAVDRAGLAAACQSFDAIWFRLGHRIDAEVLGACPRVKVIATAVTGLDHIDLIACAARGIKVVSLKGEVAFLRTVLATAEHTLGLTLALLRNLTAAAASAASGAWTRDPFRGGELSGRSFGIVGVGRLGTLVADRVRAFGAIPVGCDPHPDRTAGIERWASLDELCATCDIVSLHVSYGPATHHLIGTAQLTAMRPGTLLINTARGGVLDSVALLAALERGHLGGAALDVIEGEPDLGADHPLARYARAHPERLILTPHIGGNTRESFEKTEVFLADRVLAALGLLP
jgi:D-3-phosphoglycerate dehydrogenase